MATDADIQLSDLLEANPSSLNPNFQDLISNKKDYAELASGPDEKLKAGKFQFFNHQIFVHRFMRNYDDLLDISQTGTGKSGSTIGFFEKCRLEFEKIKTDPNNADKKMAHFKRVIILVNGPTQKAEFRKQLLKTAADDFFEIEKSDKDAKAEKTSITNRIKKAGYIIKTYRKFASEIRGIKSEKAEKAEKVVKKKGYRSYPFQEIDQKASEAEIAERIRQNEESTRNLIADFSDSIFWIDEAHNLNLEPDKFSTYKEKIEIYKTISWVFHTVLRSKRIISTATPMLNAPEEIVFLLNLLLPADGALPIGYDYRNSPPTDIKTFFPGFPLEQVATATPEEIGKFFRGQIYVKLPEEMRKLHKIAGNPYDGNDNLRIPMNIQNVTFDQLEPYLRGKIMFIRAADTGATPVEQGLVTVIESEYNKQIYRSVITTYNTFMSEYQNEGYQQVKPLKSEMTKNKDDIYTAARQMANFRFPQFRNKSVFYEKQPQNISNLDTEEVQEVSDVKENHEVLDPEIQGDFKHFIKAKGDRYTVSDEFLQEVGNNLHKYGCKYAANIDIVDTTPGNAFTYGTYVEGSGAIALAACYEARGYERFDESSSVFINGKIRIKKAKRYAILIGSTPNSRLDAMMELMVSPENRFGDYIKCLISSRTGRDGINVDNVLQIHLLGSEWNESANYQARSRGIRATSHDLILKEYQDIINDLTDACDRTLLDDSQVDKAFDLIAALSGGLKLEWNGLVNKDNIDLFIANVRAAMEMSVYNDMKTKVDPLIVEAEGDDLDEKVNWTLENVTLSSEDSYLLLAFREQRKLRVTAEKLLEVLENNYNGQANLPDNLEAINNIFPEKSALYQEVADNNSAIHALLENSLRLIKDLTTRVLTHEMYEEYQVLKKYLLSKVKDDYVKTVPPTAAVEIRIYKHAAIPLQYDDDGGIDIMMYKIVERKSHGIMRIMDMLIQASIGYQVFKDRNFRPTDEKQYTGPEIDYEHLDYSTYDLVYSKEIVDNLAREIADIYRDHMSLTFTELLTLLPKYQVQFVAAKLSVVRNIYEINQLLPIYQNDYIYNLLKSERENLSYYEEKYMNYVLDKLKDHNINREDVTAAQIKKWFPIHRNDAMLAVIKGIKTLRDLKDNKKLSALIPAYREKYVVMALENIITNKTPLLDKYGHTVYLRENDGFFYLTRTYPINSNSSYSMAYYTQNIIAVKHNNMNIITEVQSTKLGNDSLSNIERNFPTDRDRVIEFLDELPIEAQERVLEDVLLIALNADANYLLDSKYNRGRDYIDFIIEKHKNFIIWMHEPVADITLAINEQLHPKSKQGRKKDLTKTPKDKRYKNLDDFREKMERNQDTEIVYMHTLDSKVGGLTQYAATAKIAKGEGRVPILKLSEIKRGWRDLEGIEKDVYRPYIQEILAQRGAEFLEKNENIREYQIYGTMIAGQFRIVDAGKESNKAKTGSLSSKSRGLACGGPSGKTIPKPYLIDVLLRIEAPLPPNNLPIVTDANRDDIIEKLMNGTGHSTLKDPANKRITDQSVIEEWSNEKLHHYNVWIYTKHTTQQMADAIFDRLDSIGAVKYE